MPKLGVNIDHIATLRQARGGNEPDPIAGAVIAELAGADGITIHLREDRRHMQDRDLKLLRQIVKTKLNLEMANNKEIIKIALSVVPDMITIVPEKREELTTEGGLDVLTNSHSIEETINLFRSNNILVSLFIDPDPDQIKEARKIKTDFVEIHTGKYANSKTEIEMLKELNLIEKAVELADKSGLRINAGHGLNYKNVIPIAHLHKIEELNIGHSIISRSVLVGLDKAIREMIEAIHYGEEIL
ncbi:MAG: pyridoxine 5'-phosphate synthase [Candidatus Firestonebacteria bacterium]|nr:pyridoxine 5'-phosphate synthase [Candidatus Firestonebacteria bacterium]